jgi:hypothetical protein
LKNKGTYRIILFLSLCVGLFGCAGASREENKSDNLKGVSNSSNNASYEEQETQADSISSIVGNTIDNEVRTFRQSALQKFDDFLGYTEILSNKKYDPELRNEALDQALQLFDEADSNRTIYMDEKHQKVPAKAFLDSLVSSAYDSISVDMNPGTIDDFVTSGDSGRYSSLIHFSGNVYQYKDGKKSTIVYLDMSVDIIVKETHNSFGEVSRKVYLGSIKNQLKRSQP